MKSKTKSSKNRTRLSIVDRKSKNSVNDLNKLERDQDLKNRGLKINKVIGGNLKLKSEKKTLKVIGKRKTEKRKNSSFFHLLFDYIGCVED